MGRIPPKPPASPPRYAFLPRGASATAKNPPPPGDQRVHDRKTGRYGTIPKLDWENRHRSLPMLKIYWEDGDTALCDPNTLKVYEVERYVRASSAMEFV